MTIDIAFECFKIVIDRKTRSRKNDKNADLVLHLNSWIWFKKAEIRKYLWKRHSKATLCQWGIGWSQDAIYFTKCTDIIQKMATKM